jgi:hypothetical protein
MSHEHEVAALQAHVAALRAALESSLIYVESFPSSNAHDLAAIKAALAATPEQSLAALRNEAAAEAKGAAWDEYTKEAVHQVEEIAGNLPLLDELCSRSEPDEMALALQQLSNEAAAEALEREARQIRLQMIEPRQSDIYARGSHDSRRRIAADLEYEARRLREAANG